MSAARNKRRRYRRRGRFGFLYKMLAVLALGAAVLMGATVFFRVEDVVVLGNTRYSAEQVVRASEVEQGDYLFHMNKYETARLIRRSLPYVEAVNIRRSLPDILLVTVTECRAAACVDGGEERWLISSAGKVLERVESGDVNVILVEGLDPVRPEAGTQLMVRQEQRLRTDGLLALLQALEQCGMLDRASHVDMSRDASILMQLDGRFTVKLPIGGDFVYLLSAMEKAIATLEPYERGGLDLTVKDYTVIFSPE